MSHKYMEKRRGPASAIVRLTNKNHISATAFWLWSDANKFLRRAKRLGYRGTVKNK